MRLLGQFKVFIIFLRKDFARTKKHKKHQIGKKQPSKNTKRQNKQTKIKNTLKKTSKGGSNLFAYLRFCVFCARKEKKKENKT